MALRITAGKWRGFLLKVPRGDMRPTQDRVRLAVFSTLASQVPGARVLDLFAGTGAYGLEALSRGAASATWVENDPRALKVLRENVEACCGRDPAAGRGATVIAADVLRFLRHCGGAAPYDLIFADPPYDRDGAWLKKILSGLSSQSILRNDGLLVVEHAAGIPALNPALWQVRKQRFYGATQISYLARLPCATLGKPCQTSLAPIFNE